MSRIVRNILLLGVLAMQTSSCLQEDLIPASTQTMRLYSKGNVSTTTDPINSKAVLLFWELDKFKDVSLNRPFLASEPESDIDSYKATPYDTHTLYPPKDNIVVAVGYSPQELVVSIKGGEKTYLTLDLPKGTSGATTDLLTSEHPVHGSASQPFDKGEPLQFIHAQSKVTFQAKLANDMDIAIRNVRVELGNKVLTGSLKWNQAQERFVTQAQQAADVFTIGQTNPTQALNKTTPTAVGTVYVLAEMESVPVKITVEKSGDNFATTQTTTFKAELNYEIVRDPTKPEDKDKQDNRLYAGEAYTFTLIFNKTALSLIGKKEPWEDGGKISIPIYPNGEGKKP